MTFFTLTGMAFWAACLLSVVAFISIAALAENKRPWSALLLFGLSFWAFVGYLKIPFVTMVTENRIEAIYILLIFFVLGVIFSFLKWTRHTQKEVKSMRLYDYKTNGKLVLPPSIDPSTTQNKEQIVAWILFWPFSLIWTIFNDPLWHLTEFIYSQVGGVYRRISAKILEHALRDVK